MGNHGAVLRARPGPMLSGRFCGRMASRHILQPLTSIRGSRPGGQATAAVPMKWQTWTPEAGIVFGSTDRLLHTEPVGVEKTVDMTVLLEDAKESTAASVFPPETTLDYKMSQETFDKARAEPPGSPGSFWSCSMYHDTNSGAAVKVHYCRSRRTTERVCQQYFVGQPLLGLDLEWMADATRWQGARRNVCVVQLASPSHIGIFHLALYPESDGTGDELVAPTLRRILEDVQTIKAGVWIRGDSTRLRNHLHVHTRSIFELSQLHRLVKYSQTGETHLINKKLVALAAQVQEHLGLPLFKGQNVRSGDWSKRLEPEQTLYAASDVYASVQLFSALEKKRESLRPTPPRPACAELELPIQLASGATVLPATEELAEEESSDDQGLSSLTGLSAEIARLQVEAEDDTDGDFEPGMQTPSKKTRKKAAPAAQKDHRVVAADAWQVQYRQETTDLRKKTRAPPSSLRAYRLWHSHDELDPVAVAGLLREPPLQTTTVVGYILEAVKVEGLPYNKTRLRSELLDQLPVQVALMRYGRLMRACGVCEDQSSTATASD